MWRRAWLSLGALIILLGAVQGIAASDAVAYDIRHYDLLIEPDFARKSIHLRAVVEISNPNRATSFRFGLNKNYSDVSVSANEAPAAIERSNGWIVVRPSRAAGKLRLVFELHGQLGRSLDEDREVIESESLFLLWSDRFYPIDLGDWATVRTTVVLPRGFRAIAPGRLVQASSGSPARFVFVAKTPTGPVSVFADSRWIRSERRVNGFRIQTLLYPESQSYAEQIFATSGDVLKFFADLHGCYAFDQFSFVTLTGTYARRAFPGFVGYSPSYLAKVFQQTGYDAHETSLLWWGLTTRGKGPGAFQWTEGFGDYVEVLYAEERKKPLDPIFARFRSQYLALPLEQDVLYGELRGSTPQAIVHGRYPWLMQMLRDQIGAAAFRRSLRLLFHRYRFRGFTMDEFIATFEEASGQSLRSWREQWLERKGVPALTLKASAAPVGAAYRITCRIRQTGNVYDLPLEIGIETEKGREVKTVQLNQPEQEVALDVAEKPLGLALDPRDRLLIQKSSATLRWQ
ncbi:MAG TPA: hypothetical protein VLB32_07445 [Candidatus Acidoferrales bacterium]|nr:hypothetical protein [Candidatus Acidoferrales bacterium]